MRFFLILIILKVQLPITEIEYAPSSFPTLQLLNTECKYIHTMVKTRMLVTNISRHLAIIISATVYTVSCMNDH